MSGFGIGVGGSGGEFRVGVDGALDGVCEGGREGGRGERGRCEFDERACVCERERKKSLSQ